MNKSSIVIIILLVATTGFVLRKDIRSVMSTPAKSETLQNKKSGIDTKPAGGKVVLVQKWDLPPKLQKVSGITYLDAERFACIQDQESIVFIYNRKQGKIEKEIPFGVGKDCEGIAVVNQTAYVVRANGRLYVVPMHGTEKEVKEFKTPLTEKNNVEGLCYDAANNRLLLAIKDEDKGNKNYKGIYAFNLTDKQFVEEPVFKINPDDPIFTKGKSKKDKDKAIRPSGLGIHPVTKEMYVTDGPSSRLLIMDAAGHKKKLYQLGKDFPQAEGVTFSPSGDVFISNEGKKMPGNIMQVKLQ